MVESKEWKKCQFAPGAEVLYPYPDYGGCRGIQEEGSFELKPECKSCPFRQGRLPDEKERI